MKTTYKVLWIDDEYEQLLDVKNQARNAGLTLIPFRSLEGGMAELTDNYSSYEAVLLDAKFYEKENDAAKTEDTRNVFAAQQQINKLASKKEFEIFVLSGQSSDPTIIDDSFRKSFTKFYRKGVVADVNKLWLDIRTAAEKQPIVQLRRDYPSVFAACDDRYVSKNLEPILISLLQDYDQGRLNVDHLNVIRKVLEKLTDGICGYGLVPESLDTLNTVARFLRGDWSGKSRNDTSYKLDFKHSNFPAEVGWMISSLANTTQAGSHPLYLDAHLRKMETDYWLKASFFQMLALLEWFKPFMELDPHMEWSSRPPKY